MTELSIILTAYKEPQTISRAIEKILENKLLKDFELIVVAPDKETLDVAKIFKKKNKKIKIFQDAGKGKPFALTEVFKIAKGKILVLTDGDVYISENSIENLLKHNKKIVSALTRGTRTNEKTKRNANKILKSPFISKQARNI